jgi:lipopolysaccharide export system protein LptA
MRRLSADRLLFRVAFVAVVSVATTWVATASAEPAPEAAKEQTPNGGLFDVGEFGKSKEPITITADQLDYDYKANVVVYHGTVQATQGRVVLHSDQLRITFDNAKDATKDAKADKSDKAEPLKPSANGTPDPGSAENGKVKEIIATGTVRIDQGTRYATGGKAVFDQTSRTVVLTENPVLHDGPNEVAGDKVIVFIDDNRSVVEGGRKRVKAVVFPSKQDGVAKAPDAKTPETKTQ